MSVGNFELGVGSWELGVELENPLLGGYRVYTSLERSGNPRNPPFQATVYTQLCPELFSTEITAATACD